MPRRWSRLYLAPALLACALGQPAAAQDAPQPEDAPPRGDLWGMEDEEDPAGSTWTWPPASAAAADGDEDGDEEDLPEEPGQNPRDLGPARVEPELGPGRLASEPAGRSAAEPRAGAERRPGLGGVSEGQGLGGPLNGRDLDPDAAPTISEPLLRSGGQGDFDGTDLGRDLSDAPARARLGQGIQLSPWLTLRPVYRFSLFYNSNVFRSSEDEVSDVIMVNAIGADLAAQRGNSEVAVGYVALIRTFFDNSELDAVDHRARVSAASSFGRARAELRADVGRLSRPSDPRFTEGTLWRTSASGAAAVEYALTRRVGLRGEANLTYQSFDDDEVAFFDQIGYGVNGLAFYDPGGPLRFEAGAGYQLFEYTHSDAVAPDLAVYTLFAGAATDGARRLSGELRLGYQFSEVVERRTFPEGEDGPAGLFVSGRGTFRATERTSLTLEAARQIGFGTRTPTVFTTVSLGAEQELRRDISIFGRVGFQVFEPEEQDSIYSYQLLGGATWRARRWAELGAQLGYQLRDSDDRDFDVVEAGLSITLTF